MTTPSTDAQTDYQRFIAKMIESEVIWTLENEDAFACADSNDDEGAVVLLFWSDRADAKRARKTRFKEYEVAELSLFEFLFQWLSGMAEDEVLTGMNWSAERGGPEVDSEQLQDDILQAMGDEMRDTYFDRLQLTLGVGGPVG